ncbi:MAG TPA: SGNH/GDSL hydrolase family protein [Candidatus Binatia bacterium]
MTGLPAEMHGARDAGDGRRPADRPWRRRAGTAVRILLALLAPWVVLEVALRLAGYQPPDLRPRMALFPRFPAMYEPHRELGWVLKPNLDYRGLDLAIPFRTDANGNRVHGTAPTAPEEVAVDCIGDSSTFGYGVPDDETYPARLEALLASGSGAPVRVRNLGVPGYTVYEARLLAERDGAHAPVTLVMVGFNDHFPATRTRFWSLWARRAAYACFRSRACALLFDVATAPDPEAPPAPPKPASRYVPDVAPDEYEEQLVRTVRALREAGSTPILLVYPSLSIPPGMPEAIARHWNQPLDQVEANIAAHPVYQDITRRVGAREGVQVIDLAPVFDAAGNDRLHLDWVHPNAEGQALIATTVADAVRRALAESAGRSTSNR